MEKKTKTELLQPWSPAHYRIEVQGEISESWADYFSGMHITTRKRADQTVITLLSGRVMDQAELTGLLNNLAEIHLPILLVEQITDL